MPNILFINVPAITLPNGVAMPEFQVGQYLCGEDPDGEVSIAPHIKPWTRINFSESQRACAAIGGKLITELEYLAIAYDIVQQDINWTGGKVGEGNVFQGLHMGTVRTPQPGEYVSRQEQERRWHQLSNGERIYDFAGNAYTWIFDDVQGNLQGVVAHAFAENSASITTAPYPSMQKGMGWRPRAGSNWSGFALVRGGFWNDGDVAGVFYLSVGSPGYRYGLVGFRCTK
ncbi:hypothetical protein GJ700_12485 [Duganella sp. FT92W]|uniref:SUMF1/EgtB/PvdO family nonheme iron enzyme n=1 Tax=Pseudoduganella rivuli TaxID=2666085 RepID=A0A7X2LTZ9_9BURK|nr:hypothetical protein [Pseudoduganella rivuli]MRV72527.1 hypothetical protein [Pseudoduganella rivuli]